MQENNSIGDEIIQKIYVLEKGDDNLTTLGLHYFIV
jgi:hypothetical protein